MESLTDHCVWFGRTPGVQAPRPGCAAPVDGQGWALAAQQQGEEDVAQMRHGLTGIQTTGAALIQPYYRRLLAEACGIVGQVEDGLTMLADVLAEVHRAGESWTEAELYRPTGELLRRQSVVDVQQGEAYFQQALDVARHQQAKAIELRAVMSLRRLWQQ
jgi:predicted ATPase